MLSNNQVQLFCTGNPQSSSTLISNSSSSSSSSSSNSATNLKQNMINNNNNNNRQSANNLVLSKQSSEPRVQIQTNQNNNQVQSNPVQIQNYITWINSHLKKRPGVRLVENLHSDLSNGVSLIHLIEVISGTALTDVNLNPKSQMECKENIEKILKFMQQNSIKMHQTTSKEILEGNLKSIMRLILALAAHFKPTNVQPYSTFISKLNSNNTNSNTTSTSSSSLTNSTANNNNNNNNRQNLMVNKRSQSTNNVNTNANTNTNNTYSTNNLNNTYVVNNTNQINLAQHQQHQQLQQQQQQSKPVLNQTRNLDSMTHLVQAACVSLADVRRYKNENFNVKYVKRNNLLSSPSSKSNSNYLNPINLNSNQTYTVNNNINNNNNNNIHLSPKNSTMISTASFLLSPNSAQPIASSTVLQPPSNIIDATAISIDNSNFINLKYIKNKTYSLDRPDKIEEEEYNIKNDSIVKTPVKKIDAKNNSESNSNNTNQTDTKTMLTEVNQNSQTSSNNNSNSNNSNKKEEAKNNSQSQKDEFILYSLEENEININEVQNVKKMLLNLQTLLMNCNVDDLKPTDDENLNNLLRLNKNSQQNDDPNTSTNSSTSSNEIDNNLNPLSNLSPEEQISIFRSKIQQLEILNTDLKNELNQFKNEAINKNGIQSGLRTRINEQDNTILEMKNEHINLQLNNENLFKEKEDLRNQLSSCMEQINHLKTELLNKDNQIERIKSEMNGLIKEKNEQTKFVRQQVKSVTDTLDIVQEKENALSGMIANADRKLSILNNNLNSHASKKELALITNLNNSKSHTILTQEELNSVKESILKLRQNFSSNHPSQLLINVIEQNFSNLVDKSNSNLNTISTSSINPSSSSSGSSSLTSSSANSPVQTIPNTQSPTSTSSVHSSSSSISGLSYQNSQSQKSNTIIEACSNNSKSDNNLSDKQTEIPVVNNESNVKKIISRLLSQTYVVPAGINQAQTNQNNSNQVKSEQNLNNKTNKLSHMWENCVSSNKQPVNSLLAISSTCTSSSSNGMIISTCSSTEIVQSQATNVPLVNNHININQTKCIYYLDKSSTPFLTTISKNIGSISLNDFKEAIKLKHSNYRFRFKSQDPEFGILKEEISNDCKILPSFEGKIIAWIETIV